MVVGDFDDFFEAMLVLGVEPHEDDYCLEEFRQLKQDEKQTGTPEHNQQALLQGKSSLDRDFQAMTHRRPDLK